MEYLKSRIQRPGHCATDLMDDGSFPEGAARYLYPSLAMRAGEGALGGVDGLSPRVPERRSCGAVGQTRSARHVTECHGHARSLFMLCCSPSSPWGAARHGGRQGLLYPRGIDPPAAIMCGCPGAGSDLVYPQVADKGSRDPCGMHDKAGKSLRHMVRGAPVGLCPNAVAGCPCPPTGARRRGHVHGGLFAARGSPVRPAIARAVCRDDRSG